jgi:hypothetical protein
MNQSLSGSSSLEALRERVVSGRQEKRAVVKRWGVANAWKNNKQEMSVATPMSHMCSYAQGKTY